MRQPTPRIYALDILRGLMALAVVVYHTSLWTELFTPAGSATTMLAKLGIYGVQGFFVISGFCFFHLYGATVFEGPALKTFFLKRWMRLAPLFFLVVGLNLLFHQKAGPDPSTRMLAENLTLSFGFFHPNHALAVGGWSIGVEAVFYVALPSLIFFTRRHKGFLYLFAALLVWASLPWSLHRVPEAEPWNRFHAYVQVANHAFLFLLGGVLAHLRSRTAFRLRPLTFTLCLLLLGAITFSLHRGFYDHFDIMAGAARYQFSALCVAVVGCFAFMDMQESPGIHPLVVLGDLSYGTYLLHPLAHALLLWAGVGRQGWPMFSQGLLLTLVFAYGSHRFIEKPAMALARGSAKP
ncbi:MAG: acyltransferase [Acidobacteriota bacterium]|nr:acyltransferase [Acidobacteriota bacterium]